ncbi:MAG TPA: class I SAM-dependent methyltransferase [Halomicronema sp.]
MSDTLTKLAYQTLQQGKSVFALTHKNLSTQLMKTMAPAAQKKLNSVPTPVLLSIQKRLNEILELDWQDAEKGVYSHDLLLDNSWEDFVQFYPQVLLDLPNVWQRIIDQKYQQFSPKIATQHYPSYYVQNFHHQTDGYLSDFSANLYDLQVELLFNGGADPMRRRILAPLKQGIEKYFPNISPSEIKILDVACGTGRTLKFIRATLPKASLFGVDLSPSYLRKANQLLSKIPGELPQLLHANAENLPYRDNYFHAVTSVFLFHELPPSARQQVIDECFRVAQPGGIFVICDSLQVVDVPEYEPIMENFCEMFHEPYYRHYINDDLIEKLEKSGFINVSTQNHFMSKYIIAHKPF